MSSLDLSATALAASGVPGGSGDAGGATEAAKDGTPSLDGVDLWPLFTGKKSGDPHEMLFWRMKARNIWAVRKGDWKLVSAHGWHGLPASVGKPRLVNLGSDPRELLDVSAQNPERFGELKAAFSAWEKLCPSRIGRPA